jgi:hypothetical protein
VPAGAVGFKGPQKLSEQGWPGTRGLMRVPDEARQAMNMRAAEASVSSVPTPMKILPIRELWSQAVL